MAVPGKDVDINNLVLFGQYVQLTVQEFSNMTLRQIVNSPSFSAVVDASPTLLGKYHLGFGVNSTTDQAARIMATLPSDDACEKGQTMCGVLTAISFFLILMRMSSRWMSGAKLRWDDHLCWMAFVVSVLVQSTEVAACHLSSVHGGRHFWDVTISQYRNILIFAFALEFTYYPNLCLIKCSIILFYYYLFRAQPRLQTVCKVLAWLLVVGNVFAIMGFFQFKPIDHWNHILDAKPAFHRYAYFSSIGYITIITDFIILALPMSALPKLRLTLREKIILAGLFLVGTCACVASILRLISLKPFCNDQDWSYASANTAIWSMLELHLAIFCACVPNLKMLASRCATCLKKWGVATFSSHKRLASSLSIVNTGKGRGGDDIECGTVTNKSRRQDSQGPIMNPLDDFDNGSKWSKSVVGCHAVSISSQAGMNDFVNPCAGGPMPTALPLTTDFTPPAQALSPIASALEPIDFEAEHAKHQLGLARNTSVVVATGILDSYNDDHDLENELREMVREVEEMRRPKNEAAQLASGTSPPMSSDSEKCTSFETERTKKETL